MGEVPDDKLGHHRLKLDRIAFYGRTLGEYLLMFGINDIRSLKRYNTILDCPSGASSFVAEANTEHGIQAVGCDRLFDKDVETLSKGGQDDIEYVIQRVSTDPNQKSSSQPYEQMTELLFALEGLRIKFDIVPVPFEFQRGSNKMLLLKRTDRS